MELHEMGAMVVAGMQIMRGCILKIEVNGEILVESDCEDSVLLCQFLRTSASPLPKLNPGDSVLCATDEKGTYGYVLGVIQKYFSDEEERQDKSTCLKEDVKEIRLKANDRIEMRCGKSSLVMNNNGRIILKGAEIVSRASKVNKIKGSAVKIN